MPYGLIDTALNAAWWLSAVMFFCFLGILALIGFEDFLDDDRDNDA